ncbi:MAG: helix-turn-helix domain-containing protein [Actinomycetota bacterium]|nr:helix-turn-helix domain-containing protein [Actinomycetota bacterium]
MRDPELLSTSEAAEILGTSGVTVNRWAITGKLPVAHKMPGRTGAYLFARSDVEAFRRTERVAS